MHKHRPTDNFVKDHPLLSNIVGFLKKRGVTEDIRGFLTDRIFFLYPKAFGLRLAATKPDEVKIRSDLDPRRLGNHLNAWLHKTGEFHRVVLDLNYVTIVDSLWIDHFIDAVKEGLNEHYIICPSDLTAFMGLKATQNASAVLPDCATLIKHLRHSSNLSEVRVRIPESLDCESLNKVLKKVATTKAMRSYDVVTFDFSSTSNIDFESISMMPAIIHSMAHQHGLLSKIISPRLRVLRTIKKFDVFRVVEAYLLGNTQSHPEGYRAQAESGLRMTAFTVDELFELKDLFADRLASMARGNLEYFFGMAGIRSTGTLTEQTRLQALRLFRELVKELLDNVAMHAFGLGYFMFDFDPSIGLRFYIGDSGIGLAKGLKAVYKGAKFNDEVAVSKALSLIEMKDRRKKYHGTVATGGRGLERVNVILGSLKGTITVRTGTASAIFTPGKGRSAQVVHRDLYYVEGTHIHILIPARVATVYHE